jgi:hypothetical protein
MASPPASTKTSLGQKLRARARARWPQLTGVDIRFRGQFAYVTGQLPGGQDLPLCRLRYVGYASIWGFAIYRASHDDYQDNYLPSGQPSGTPRTSPRLRLRPLPQRPHRLATSRHRYTYELTGSTTSAAADPIVVPPSGSPGNRMRPRQSELARSRFSTTCWPRTFQVSPVSIRASITPGSDSALLQQVNAAPAPLARPAHAGPRQQGVLM